MEISENKEEKSMKKKPVFNSIEEFEKNLNDGIKDKLSVFLNIVKDVDLFKKMCLMENIKQNGEVNISPNLEKLLEEIKTSDIIKNKIEENIHIASEQKTSTKKEYKRVHYYFCKENGTNLAVTDILNPFHQKQIQNNFVIERYFSKNTEMQMIDDLIIEKLKKIIKTKFRLAFDEGVENERWTSDGTKIISDESQIDQGSKQMYSTNMRRKMINSSIKRLYPKPSLKENINDQFYVDKINEFNYNGEYLAKKVNFNNLYKEFKIPYKENYKTNPMDDLKLTDDIMKDYLDNKNKKDKNISKSTTVQKDEVTCFKRGDLYFDKNSLLLTKSKMYIKVDRKDYNKEFKLIGEHIDNKSPFLK